MGAQRGEFHESCVLNLVNAWWKIEALKLGMEKGEAFIVDDNSNSTPVMRMRPNKSWHGGDELGALER